MHSSRTYFREKLNIGKQRKTAPPPTTTTTKQQTVKTTKVIEYIRKSTIALILHKAFFPPIEPISFVSLLCFLFLANSYAEAVNMLVGCVFAGILLCLGWLANEMKSSRRVKREV